MAQWPKDEEIDAELILSEYVRQLGLVLTIQRGQGKPPGSTREIRGTYIPSRLEGTQVSDREEGHSTWQFPKVRTESVTALIYSAQGLNGIKANVKAIQGEVYFLDKGLLFIAKQPILIDFSKTESIAFSR